MATRDQDLQAFLDTLRAAIEVRAGPETSAGQAAGRIFSALAAPGRQGAVSPVLQPVNDHLGAALDMARCGSAEVSRHARAVEALAPRLAWYRRPGTESEAEPFASGHANAIVVGPGGLEERADVRIGISLMAPDVVYPDHHHPPEEVYLVLSPGAWRQDDRPWHEPGRGGIVYNPPGILHAMRSTGAPLLATWSLWTGLAAA